MASIEEFRKFGKEMIDYVADYWETVHERNVLPDVTTGFFDNVIPEKAPDEPETYKDIMNDIEKIIMPGMTHWTHPMFNAYFHSAISPPSVVADILSTSIIANGISWIASPISQELEMAMMDWLADLLSLPEEFMFSSKGKGGGVIQGTASDATLMGLLAAKGKYKTNVLSHKLVVYTSIYAHSSAAKAAKIAGIQVKLLETDGNYSVRGQTFREAIEKDKKEGLIPCCCIASLGTTSSCAFDNLEELGEICKEEDIWLHVDAAYAGAAFVCEEYHYLTKGIEYVDSFNFNLHKWFLVSFDCAALWLRNYRQLTDFLNADLLILNHDQESVIPDYRHWQVQLGRKFRSLKVWFSLRLYGKSGLQKHIRHHVDMAKLFESFIIEDEDFEIVAPVILGLTCFRMKGSNELNEQLLKSITKERKLFITPSTLGDTYMLRYAASDCGPEFVKQAYEIVRNHATNLKNEESS